MLQAAINRKISEVNRHMAIDPEYFTKFELDFIAEKMNDVLEDGGTHLTVKQIKILDDLAEKVKKR